MTSAEDRNNLVTTQEKLEWVTPQISQMVAGDAHGGGKFYSLDEVSTVPPGTGPS